MLVSDQIICKVTKFVTLLIHTLSKQRCPIYWLQAQAICLGVLFSEVGTHAGVRLQTFSSHSHNKQKTTCFPPLPFNRYLLYQKLENHRVFISCIALNIIFISNTLNLKLYTSMASNRFQNLILRIVMEEQFHCQGSFWDSGKTSQWYVDKWLLIWETISCPLHKQK